MWSRASLSVLLLSALAIAGALSLQGYAAQAQGSWTYYGHIPGEVWLASNDNDANKPYVIRPETVVDYGRVTVIGAHDQTHVEVYVLPDKALVKSISLSKLEKSSISLPNGTFFKVVSDKPATVVLMGGVAMERGEAYTTTFWTGTSGGYVDREFVFIALQGKSLPTGYVGGLVHRVYALEKSDVTIQDSSGSTVSEFKLQSNGVNSH